MLQPEFFLVWHMLPSESHTRGVQRILSALARGLKGEMPVVEHGGSLQVKGRLGRSLSHCCPCELLLIIWKRE